MFFFALQLVFTEFTLKPFSKFQCSIMKITTLKVSHCMEYLLKKIVGEEGISKFWRMTCQNGRGTGRGNCKIFSFEFIKYCIVP